MNKYGKKQKKDNEPVSFVVKNGRIISLLNWIDQ